MNVCILMFYDDPIKQYAEINYNINKLYCEKNNLKLLVSNKRLYENRHPAWEKLTLILQHINHYDYIIWIDADAFLYIDADNIVNIIEKNKEANFIFSNDKNENIVNTGIFIVKNSEYSINFLKKWTYDPVLYKNNPYPKWWENGVLINMINKNILNIKENCIRCRYGVLQHFGDIDLINIEPRPLIKHMAGKNKDIRIKASSKYFEYLKNINK